MRIEAIPALVVFTIKLLVFGPNELTWTSVVSGIFSGVMLGRKTSGGAKKEELIAQKRELEEELEKLGGGKRVSMHGSMKAVESVFGAAAAREMEVEVEEDLGELPGSVVDAGGDIEMAETRPVELPGSVADEIGDAPGSVGDETGDLRAQLEQARADADELRAENSALRRRVRGVEA